MTALRPPPMQNRSKPTEKVRVMLVDDSRVARAVIHSVLDKHAEIQVVAEASDSEEALNILSHNSVDIILLDIEMPRRSGIDALPDLIKVAGAAKIIVVSSFVKKFGPAALKALSLGACDTLAKPGRADASGQFGRDLTDMILRLALRKNLSDREGSRQSQKVRLRDPDCIAIGASTGGIPIIFDIIKNLDEGLHCPVFVVQHLPEAFMHFFAGQLQTHANRPVSLAIAGDPVLPGQIYVAPGNAHLICRRDKQRVFLDHYNDTKISRYCPSVDVLFASLADVYREKTLAFVLSGMGNDGAAGARALSEKGAQIIVQDEDSSIVWGMPGAVVREGLATAIMSPSSIKAALSELAR